MIDLGKKIATDLHGGDVVLLYGDLGAGKTTLTKGLLGLGIGNIEPTFTLMQVYNVRNTKTLPTCPTASRGGRAKYEIWYIDT